jgi:transposase
MLCLIPIVGGLLIMMGQHDRSEALFYYFRLEDQIPENHLRLIDKHISFEFVRQRLKDSYSETGRPSIDPELLLRILLVSYLYGITSERKLVEELRMHLAWRWFTGLGFDQEIPHHSTFSQEPARTVSGIVRKPLPRRTCSPVSRIGKGESRNRWRRIRPTGTGSSCNG